MQSNVISVPIEMPITVVKKRSKKPRIADRKTAGAILKRHPRNDPVNNDVAKPKIRLKYSLRLSFGWK
jgi:hypothetical protein